MPKREEAITITASPDVEANIAAICYHLGLDPQAHGAGQKAIREALTIAVTVLAQRLVYGPPRQEQEEE
jgi:hypothetical protein